MTVKEMTTGFSNSALLSLLVLYYCDELWWCIKIVFVFIVMYFLLQLFSQFLLDLNFIIIFIVIILYFIALRPSLLLHFRFGWRIYSHDACDWNGGCAQIKTNKTFFDAALVGADFLVYHIQCLTIIMIITCNRYKHQPPIDALTTPSNGQRWQWRNACSENRIEAKPYAPTALDAWMSIL